MSYGSLSRSEEVGDTNFFSNLRATAVPAVVPQGISRVDEWKELAADFEKFKSAQIAAEWSINHNTQVRSWEMRPTRKNRDVELCFELCRGAGKRLRASAYLDNCAPQLKGIVDDTDRWLEALVEIFHVDKITGEVTHQEGTVVTKLTYGEIKNLGEASQLLCLRLAAQ